MKTNNTINIIPETFTLAGVKWEVKHVDSIGDSDKGSYTIGREYPTCTIKLSRNWNNIPMRDDKIYNNFCHELMHAFIRTTDYHEMFKDSIEEERFVTNMGNMLMEYTNQLTDLVEKTTTDRVMAIIEANAKLLDTNPIITSRISRVVNVNDNNTERSHSTKTDDSPKSEVLNEQTNVNVTHRYRIKHDPNNLHFKDSKGCYMFYNNDRIYKTFNIPNAIHVKDKFTREDADKLDLFTDTPVQTAEFKCDIGTFVFNGSDRVYI